MRDQNRILCLAFIIQSWFFSQYFIFFQWFDFLLQPFLFVRALFLTIKVRYVQTSERIDMRWPYLVFVLVRKEGVVPKNIKSRDLHSSDWPLLLEHAYLQDLRALWLELLQFQIDVQIVSLTLIDEFLRKVFRCLITLNLKIRLICLFISLLILTKLA